ncbi:MAG: GNAT family N-acetyltransferase [Bacteroidetes bacterium]|nr:GNAT family N-acetyltransferase [Bacteroidota bacterium]
MEISLANQDDLETILQLQKDSYISEAEIHDDYDIPPLHEDLKSIENDFAKMTILKGEFNGQIIASVRGHSKNGTCYIGRLVVSKDFQNKGIGRMLMDSIEAKHMDCNRFELFTGFKSQKSLYLYNKLGYREYKQQKINDKLTLIYLDKTKQ